MCSCKPTIASTGRFLPTSQPSCMAGGLKLSYEWMSNDLMALNVLANFTLLGGGLGRRIRPKPPALGRCGGARVPSGCPLRTSPTVKMIAARRNLVLARLQRRERSRAPKRSVIDLCKGEYPRYADPMDAHGRVPGMALPFLGQS